MFTQKLDWCNFIKIPMTGAKIPNNFYFLKKCIEWELALKYAQQLHSKQLLMQLQREANQIAVKQ